MPSCPATSAVAARIPGFARRSKTPRSRHKEATMEKIIKNEARRDFLKVSGTVAGGLALGFYLPSGPRVAQAAAPTHSPNAWVKIGTDNSITIMCARSEMGQDVYTSMPILVAEELEVDLNKVKVEFAQPAEVYINALLGGQLTG